MDFDNRAVQPKEWTTKFDNNGEAASNPQGIRDRLRTLGVPLQWKPSIRIAPVKGSGLSTNYIESKVVAVEKWVATLKALNSNLGLPQIESVRPVWETPKDGNRFKILRVSFKSTEGLIAMHDLLYGSKIDLIEGFPQELEEVRDKIYISLAHPHKRRARQDS